jgi:polyphenol oxidase
MSLRFELPKPSIDARLLGAHRVSVLTDDDLFEAIGTRIAFTGRDGGVSNAPYASLNLGGHVGDDPGCVAQNRVRVLEALGAPDAPLVVPNQVHKTDVVLVGDSLGVQPPCACDASSADGVITEPAVRMVSGSSAACRAEDPVDIREIAQAANESAAAGCDALVVRTAGIAALLNFADCTPVIIVSPSGNFAIAHAGWRGAVAGVAGKAARALIQADIDAGFRIDPERADDDPFGSLAAACNAYIGPHIQAECFETGADVAQRFREAFPDSAQAVVPDDRHVDLSQAVVADLLAAGLSLDRIFDTGICTMCNSSDYFSYRAEGGSCGRHGAVAIKMEDDFHDR